MSVQGEKQMPESKDSYEIFLNKFGIDKDRFYSHGIEETIWPPIEKVKIQWEDLKKRVFNNGIVTIRGYGRDAKNTGRYFELYELLFSNSKIKKDRTNNAEPRRILSGLTGYKINDNLFNYQISHIFGKAKNCFLFEASWNLVFVPKIIDPLTGHETKGTWPVEYQELFRGKALMKYRDFVDDYNELITKPDVLAGIKEFVSNLKTRQSGPLTLQFAKDVSFELSPILNA
jgi:hypothetical protein